MIRRLGPALAVALVAVTVPASAPAEAPTDAPRLTQLGSARFPERAFALTLGQQRPLVATDVEVLENGEPVATPSLVPADRLGSRGFGIVLVIDASYSMRGEPIAGAMTAARAFAGRRRADQPLGAIAFNQRATTVLPLTADQGAIDAALASAPPLAGGTAIRDAALAGVEMLRTERMLGGSIVLLSDGADTSSQAGMPRLVDAARQAGARIFTVGLKSGTYRAEIMDDLANATGGSYALASSPRRLEGIFDRLGAVLSSQYLLRYRSLARPRERVTVEVRVRGEAATASVTYTTPALALGPLPPFRRSGAQLFWLSPAAALAAALACALLLGATMFLILRQRGGGLLERVRQFVPLSAEDDEPEMRLAVRAARPSRGSWLSLSGLPSWERLKEDLDIARIEVSAERLSLMTLAATLVAAWLCATFSGTRGTALIGLAVPVAVGAFVRFKARRQRRAFEEQLPDNVQVVASAMRAGQSFVGALALVVEEAAEPSRREFKRVVHDERLGKPIEESLSTAAARMRNEELDHVGLVARLQSQTGGNTAEVLDRLVETLRARAELRRLVRTLTAQGRLGGYVVSSLPVILLVVLTLLSRDYADKIFGTASGRIMLVISAVLIALGSFVIRRIVDIKV